MPTLDQIVFDYMLLLTKLRSAPRFEFLTARSSEIPKESGTYLITDKSDSGVINIGETGDLRRRLLSDHKGGNIEGSQFRKVVASYYLHEYAKESSPELEQRISEHIVSNFGFQFMLLAGFETRKRFEHFATALLAPKLNLLPKRSRRLGSTQSSTTNLN